MKAAGLLAPAIMIVMPAFAQPPAPQRTITDNRVTRGKDTNGAQQPVAAPQSTIDSLLDSTEDLNSIRDSYLRRLAGDGCRPDVAIRVAELRSRLEGKDSRGAAQDTAASQQTSFELEGSLLILAAGWYQARPEAASQRPNREAERIRLLEYVLSPETPAAGTEPSGGDRAQLKAELDRLLATCHGAGQ